MYSIFKAFFFFALYFNSTKGPKFTHGFNQVESLPACWINACVYRRSGGGGVRDALAPHTFCSPHGVDKSSWLGDEHEMHCAVLMHSTIVSQPVTTCFKDTCPIYGSW